MIPNEFEKAKKFERGMRPEILLMLAMLRLKTFHDVLDVALIIEVELIQEAVKSTG